MFVFWQIKSLSRIVVLLLLKAYFQAVNLTNCCNEPMGSRVDKANKVLSLKRRTGYPHVDNNCKM